MKRLYDTQFWKIFKSAKYEKLHVRQGSLICLPKAQYNLGSAGCQPAVFASLLHTIFVGKLPTNRGLAARSPEKDNRGVARAL